MRELRVRVLDAKPGSKKNPTAENLGTMYPLDTAPRVEEVPLVMGTTRRNRALTY